MYLALRPAVSLLFLSSAARAAAGNGAIELPSEYRSLKLGDVDFNMSSSSQQARDWFKYGLLHLFTFGYDYATPAFQMSYRNDPNFSLAYAFEALTHFWPLWGKDDLAAANAILGAAPNSTDQREDKYIVAVRRHFEPELPDEVRQRQGVEALVAIVQQYPQDATARALLGLWRLALAPLQSPVSKRDTTLQAAEVDLAAALALEPEHTGALHYQMHLYDTPRGATKGIPAAELLPVVAPDASHSSHMPVHIHLRLANFSTCYAMDVLAIKAADAVCRVYGRGDDEGCDLWNLYHSLEYLQYSAYQIGRWGDAKAAYDRMTQNLATARAKGHPQADSLELWWMRMDAREIFERGLLMLSEDPAALETMSCTVPEQLDPGFWTSYTESGSLLAHALCFVFKNRPPAADSNTTLVGPFSRRWLQALRARLAEIPAEFGTDQEDASPRYIQQVNAMHVHMLDAADYLVQGQNEAAWEEAGEAITIQSALVRRTDSPTILVVGAHEFKGMLHLHAGGVANAKLAEQAFEHATGYQGPQLSTQLGLARARRVQGCGDDARRAYELVAAMLDPGSDRQALPFWSEMQAGLRLAGSCPSPVGQSVAGAQGAAPQAVALVLALALLLTH